MMFSITKSSDCGGAETESEAGGGLIKTSMPSDEVASAVAAVSDEIVDILKDELGDADRADRIGAELADLGAELGLLAGLADEPQQNYPSLFEIAIGHRGSGSASSSSSWSGGRGGRSRRPLRPQRAPRRRPIAKGKEISRRRSAAARRAASMRVRRVEIVSDASDVGADSDSDDQWTEFDDNCTSDSSSEKEVGMVSIECIAYQDKGSQVEAPVMGQFLLPLLNTDPSAPEEHFLIRHEDILQLLASAENSVREELPLMDDGDMDSSPDALTATEVLDEYEDPNITPEDEAALLHYVCEAEVDAYTGEMEEFRPVEEWLLGVYHSWCEISALMYTLVGSGSNMFDSSSEWSYRARFGCHCRLCLGLANNESALRCLLRALVCALAHGGESALAAHVVRALQLRPGPTQPPAVWDLPRMRRLRVSATGAAIIHDHLTRLARHSPITEEIITNICLCRTHTRPFEKQYAMERLCKLLENFKTVSTINFKVELVAGEGREGWAGEARARLARCLAPHQRRPTAERLAHMAARTAPHDLSAWSGYKHRCDCVTPRTLCAQQRKQLLRISFFGMMQAMNEFNNTRGTEEKAPIEVVPEGNGRELQQGEGTGAKPPDADGGPSPEPDIEGSTLELSDSNMSGDLDDISDSDGTGASLGLSTSSSLDSASELLLFAAAAVESVESGGSGASASGSGSGASGESGSGEPGGLCRTVRHLMRSIASIERLMDRVLKHCDEWPSAHTPSGTHGHAHGPATRTDQEARKRVDMGLSEVDRKLMAMYRRLPEVHKRQLQVYRKQKKLSTVCAQLVGGSAPAPPAPASPPPAPASPPPAPVHGSCTALCPEYHLQRFKEVRRKVMHMRDQQLYYHRLRMWLEDQLRQERDSVPESNVTLVEDLPRRKRRTLSPKLPKTISAPKRKLKPTHVSQYISKPHKILQLLKHKAPALTGAIKSPYKEIDDDSNVKSDPEPPEAFPLEKEENVSDTETIVGEKESNDLSKEMKDCLVKFANFALNSPENNVQEAETEVKYPESVSPPLQEMSPTTSEPTPMFNQKPRILVNKILHRSNDKDEKVIDFHSQIATDINVPFNARVPIDKDGDVKMKEAEDSKDPDAYKYMTFGIEIKKAMEECQNIIISYNNVKDEKDIDMDNDGNYSLEQIVEVIMSLDKNTTDLLDKMDTDESIELNNSNTKLAELVENMPQILANMPEIASKLSEFANASFELPEFASIMNSLPDVNNEAQLTPETLKQIRDLKLSKRDSVKVTKNTTKRKINRKYRNSENDIISTITFDFDGKDITDLLREDNELQTIMNHKKEEFKDLLFSISAQVVISKVFEYVKNSKTPELAKYFNNDRELFSLPRHSIDAEMYNKASVLFDNSVKEALSMQELRGLVKSRFNSWKNYVAAKFKSIPVELLDSEIEAMLDKFYAYVQVLASKQCSNDSDKIIERIDKMRKNKEGSESDSDGCSAAKESLKLITKILSISAGNTFDLLIMKLSKMSQDKKASMKNLKFKYMDMVKRCSESPELICWILLDPEIATNVIQELTGLEVREIDNLPDFTAMPNERKKDYFLTKLREMNRQFMLTLPKKALTGDEWLVMLYRLEQLEDRLKDAFTKAAPPKIVQAHGASEAEILAAKGLSKIIGKANFRIVNKPNDTPKAIKKEPEIKPPTPPPITELEQEKQKNDALLAKCEAILTSKGDKALLDSFYTIKSYITQGLPVPETYKRHVISICSSIDAKLLDEDIEQTLKDEQENMDSDVAKDKNALSVIGSQNPEFLAKYSAQALRNAKQTLNVVAFRNMMRNGQSKSESDACDTPKSNCKWTNDCVCESCKDSDVSVCLGDIMRQWYDDEKTKNGLEEKKKEVKKPIQKVKPIPKMCENAVHPQHVCKAGHTNGAGSAGSAGGTEGEAGEGSDQPCTCCYCTVFGHAPPLTTPVPRNFNETRERLRSILNRKKQKCKINGEMESNAEPMKPVVMPEPIPVSQPLRTSHAPHPAHLPHPAHSPHPAHLPHPAHAPHPTHAPHLAQASHIAQVPQPAHTTHPVTAPLPAQAPHAVHAPHPVHPTHATPKPPALPKTLPPTLTTVTQKQAMENQQKQLAEKMSKMAVTEKQDNKTTAVPRPAPVQGSTKATLRADGRVNPNAMEQIRLQQLKQQQLQHMQQQLQQLQQQQQQNEHDPQTQPMPQPQQKKPEPIYDLPIHNKPQLTPQQQQQIRQQQQQQQQQQMLRQQQLQQQQLQQQQMQQQQMQQQQLQQQQLQQQQIQQRQARQQQKPTMSLSSRDTSVFSTSSGCSGGSCWRGGRAEDPRDLDALLQYIEGPARHVDRGKKKAKKQRQRAKRTEVRLLEQARQLRSELAEGRRAAAALRDAHAAAALQVKSARQALTHTRTRKKGKKQKLSMEQQSNMQLLAEILGDYTELVNSTAKELEHVENRVNLYSRQLQAVERELADARVLLDGRGQTEQESTTQYQKQPTSAPVNAPVSAVEVAAARLRIATARHNSEPALANLLRGALNIREAATTKQVPVEKKQTWEQAIAYINQQAKGSQKDKKKQKEAQANKKTESKPKPKNPPLPQAQAQIPTQEKAPTQAQTQTQTPTQAQAQAQKSKTNASPEAPPLSKKQRKLLAKQQAEEEEKRKQQAEKKEKKVEKKPEPVKETTTSKKDKKEQKNEPEGKKKKKEEKKENKKQEEKLNKDNKQDKNVPATTKTKATNKKSPPPAAAAAPTATIAAATTVDKQGSCSIMEQLSCGVQVADLRLPPGITLTRVQPTEKKEPAIKSVPLWRCGALAATPTPPARPPPVINADPNMLVFTSSNPHHQQPPKAAVMPEPQQAPAGKSKKAKKRAKKAAAAENVEQKPDGAKMVTLRNPMFHPNLPPVQIANAKPQKKSEIKIPDPIPMPPAPCQATITPTSNGMYTIRNPLMSMMHQQSLMGMRTPAPQANPMFTPPQYNYVNPNTYTPPTPTPPQQYAVDPARNSPKAPENDFQNRIMNLASFTQKNDEGYSLFKTPDDNQQKSFLAPEFFENHSPKVVSPNPIGTRPEQNRNYEDSLFVKPAQQPEPIGTPLKREEERQEYVGGLYTPFGQEDRSVFRNALFNKSEPGHATHPGYAKDEGHMNGDQLPYFQRLRAGSKLNSEVTIHYVTDSKYYKGQEVQQEIQDESLFSRPQPAWSHPNCATAGGQVGAGGPASGAIGPPGGAIGPPRAGGGWGHVSADGSPPHAPCQTPLESNMFGGERGVPSVPRVELPEREYKRFDYYEPPRLVPRVQLDMAAPLRHAK